MEEPFSLARSIERLNLGLRWLWISLAWSSCLCRFFLLPLHNGTKLRYVCVFARLLKQYWRVFRLFPNRAKLHALSRVRIYIAISSERTFIIISGRRAHCARREARRQALDRTSQYVQKSANSLSICHQEWTTFATISALDRI